MNVQAQNYLSEVRDQYEDYPYPRRDPQAEHQRLIPTFSGRMDLLISACFGGKLDLSQPFRVLVAGGGTGDSAIFLGEQLKPYPKAEIVYLDISGASMAIAQKRAEIRGLKNINFVQGSLLDVASFGWGMFDFIECSGVLHHLASPLEGLKSLASVLNQHGAMAVMLYGTYGRAGVYMMQEAMRQFAPVAKGKQDQVERCKQLIKTVNPKNLAISSVLQGAGHELADNQDIGIYDLFLHPQDVSFTVPQIYALAAGAGLAVNGFAANYNLGGKLIYNPRSYINDPQLLQDIAALPLANQQAIAEIMHGAMAMHFFYLGKQPAPRVDGRDEAVIPMFNFTAPADTLPRLLNAMEKSPDFFQFKIPPHGAELNVTITPHLRLLAEQIDGEKTIGQICDAVQQKAPSAPREALQKELLPLLSTLSGLDMMCFRYAGTPRFGLPK